MAELITKIRVISAVALSKKMIDSLNDIFTKKLGKPVEIITDVDNSLIGGLFIYIDGFILDYTVKKQLADIKDSILRRQTG